NRLASNSLLEALVFGARCGAGASWAAGDMENDYRALPLENAASVRQDQPLDLADVRNSLRSLMGRRVGIRRDHEGLQEAAENVEAWRRYVLDHQFGDPSGWQLQNMLCAAAIMISAASQREESRGVHLRLDFPETDASWNRRLGFRRGGPSPGASPSPDNQ
ncbi:MAG: hypothetical protein N2C14_28805, partial [Planctomycetales bacterium]